MTNEFYENNYAYEINEFYFRDFLKRHFMERKNHLGVDLMI